MIRITCADCLFGDSCEPSEKLCCHFSPIDEALSDLFSRCRLDIERQAFYEEWLVYLADNGDDLFFVHLESDVEKEG